MSKTTNILIAGVGGQGTVLTARVLSDILISRNYDIKVSEIHGMSQRGGSIVTQVRYGEKVFSPIIEPGTADVIIGFELMEAVRILPFLRQGGTVISNSKEINPMPVVMGKATYPKDLEKYLNSLDADVSIIDGFAKALAAGNPKCLNMVMLGAWAKKAGFDPEVCLKSVEELVPPKFLEVNIKGFRQGYNAL